MEKYYWAKPKGTGLPFDGVRLLFSTWDYTNHEMYHLTGWNDEEDEAVMLTMHQSDEMYNDMPIEEFRKLWKSEDYDPGGPFVLKPDEVEVIEEYVRNPQPN